MKCRRPIARAWARFKYEAHAMAMRLRDLHMGTIKVWTTTGEAQSHLRSI
ncbi:MAG: hypothetical protein AAF135_15770 [Bacteroidota bacterium]